MEYSPFPLVDLSGSARERGQQHGRAVPDRIKRGIAMYSESLVKNGVDWAELERRAEGDVPQLVSDLRKKTGPVFRVVTVMVEKLDFVMPPQDGAHLKDRFRQALLGRP